MKKIIYLFAILLLGITTQAQFINYQGVARDNAGNILINQPIALRLSVLSGSALGTAVYVETHATTTDGYGLFTLQIGQGTVVSGVFNDIAWSSTSFFLKVEIDPTGGIERGEHNIALINIIKIASALKLKASDLLTASSL